MSDDNKGGEQQGFTPPATQEELNKLIGERVDRERKKYADYDDVKAKAAQFDQLNESKKSDEQKTDERITALESELTAAKFAADRARIQARYSISDDDADLFLTASDAGKLEAQAKALAEKAKADADRAADRKKNGPVVPAQKGNEGGGGSDPMREMARQVFKRD